tara:strand:- start:243 stop:428 length:186 start_codon:yes stop_codon:yes gene_type:complete
VVVLLVTAQIVIIIPRVVLLVEELVAMVHHLHHKLKGMEVMHQLLLDLVEVVVVELHLIQT